MVLLDLTKTQTFDIYELTEIVVVRKDKQLAFAAFQVVTQSFEYFNNGQ